MKSILARLVVLALVCSAAPLIAQAPALSAVPEPPATCAATGSPEAAPQSGPCYVIEYCDGGGYVDCSGNTSCAAEPEYVICDGVRTDCPCYASLTCYGGSVISCTGGGPVDECEVGSNFVNCNESYTYCPVTCTASCQDGTTCNGFNGPSACFTKYGDYPETLYIECDGYRTYCGLE